jgi:uncharacterized membrane protein YkoI
MKTKLYILALSAFALLGGIGGTLALQTHAQTATTTATPAATSTQAAAPAQQRDPSKGGHVGSNGTREELLTGDTATKASAAALAAVPGGAIQRVENDAEGAVYEAHMTKADGSRVTVKLDANFNVTGTENGGPGGR